MGRKENRAQRGHWKGKWFLIFSFIDLAENHSFVAAAEWSVSDERMRVKISDARLARIPQAPWINGTTSKYWRGLKKCLINTLKSMLS